MARAPKTSRPKQSSSQSSSTSPPTPPSTSPSTQSTDAIPSLPNYTCSSTDPSSRSVENTQSESLSSESRQVTESTPSGENKRSTSTSSSSTSLITTTLHTTSAHDSVTTPPSSWPSASSDLDLSFIFAPRRITRQVSASIALSTSRLVASTSPSDSSAKKKANEILSSLASSPSSSFQEEKPKPTPKESKPRVSAKKSNQSTRNDVHPPPRRTNKRALAPETVSDQTKSSRITAATQPSPSSSPSSSLPSSSPSSSSPSTSSPSTSSSSSSSKSSKSVSKPPSKSKSPPSSSSSSSSSSTTDRSKRSRSNISPDVNPNDNAIVQLTDDCSDESIIANNSSSSTTAAASRRTAAAPAAAAARRSGRRTTSKKSSYEYSSDDEVEIQARTFMTSRELFTNIAAKKYGPVENGLKTGRIDGFVINKTYLSNDDRWDTPLIQAISCNQPKFIKLLLSHPAIDINAYDDTTRYRMTALMWAAQWGDLLSMKTLLANPQLKLNLLSLTEDLTALGFAIQQGHASIVELLLKHPHINPNTGDPSPIKLAVATPNKNIVRIVKALLEHPKLILRDFVQDESDRLFQIALTKHGVSEPKLLDLLFRDPRVDKSPFFHAQMPGWSPPQLRGRFKHQFEESSAREMTRAVLYDGLFSSEPLRYEGYFHSHAGRCFEYHFWCKQRMIGKRNDEKYDTSLLYHNPNNNPDRNISITIPRGILRVHRVPVPIVNDFGLSDDDSSSDQEGNMQQNNNSGDDDDDHEDSNNHHDSLHNNIHKNTKNNKALKRGKSISIPFSIFQQPSPRNTTQYNVTTTTTTTTTTTAVLSSHSTAKSKQHTK